MRIFTIYFEFFGKKMKTDIVALDEQDAKNHLEQKIIYHKINSKPYFFNNKKASDIFDFFNRKFK